MRYLSNNSTDPFWNLAFDEYCLESLPLEEPLFYLWRNRPAVIIGLNQNAYGEVNLTFLKEHGITLARRVTGGGAVYHDLNNLNYTIVGKTADLERLDPPYLHIMENTLRQIGVDASLSGRNDILVDGRKVSGYAKRVWHDRTMIHGTLLFDVDLETLARSLDVPGSKMAAGIASVHSKVANLKDCLEGTGSVLQLRDKLHAILAGNDSELILNQEQLNEIGRLAREKFAKDEWNLGRSPLTGFRCRHKFTCGTVEAEFCVERGVITDIRFGGDFIGNKPSDGLERALKGCRYDEASLNERLAGIGTEEVFEGVKEPELAAMLCNLLSLDLQNSDGTI